MNPLDRRFSPEIDVMLAPRATYDRLRRERTSTGWWIAWRRPLLVAAIIGTSLAIATTGRIDVGLLLTEIAVASWVVVVQLVAAIVIIRAARPPIPLPTAVDLLFTAHGPWSLLLLLGGLTAMWMPAFAHFVATLAMAGVAWPWTIALVFVFCQVVLGLERRAAARLTLLHQTIVWGAGLAYAVFAVSWPRIVGAITG